VHTRRILPDLATRSLIVCLFVVYRYSRAHLPHPPPGPGRSFSDYWLLLHDHYEQTTHL